MVLQEIQPFDITAFRQSRTNPEPRLHAHQGERCWDAQVGFIAKILGGLELDGLDQINHILEDEEAGNILAHRLIERLGINSESLADLPLHLSVEAEVVKTSPISRPHIDIRGYSFSIKHKGNVWPKVVISHCKEEGPELVVSGERVELEESDWPKLMYGLVGLVEDIQSLSENTE